VLLEPVMRVEVVVPTDCLPDVVSNLLSRRGQIQWQNDRGDRHAVRARVPLAELFAYRVDLRERTRGRGTCVIEFEDFVPRQPADDDDQSSVHAPRRPAPRPRDSAIALPEPDEEQ
jgi:translation elongation factor EF-G